MRVRVDQVIERKPQVTRRDVASVNVRPQGGVSDSTYDFGKVTITDPTPSLSATDGALVVAGGVGIGDDLNVADTIECLSLTTVSGGTVEFQGGFQSNQNSTFLQNIDVLGKVIAQGDLEHTGGNAGFFGTTPTTQPGPVADATGVGDVVAQLNALLAAMRSLGLIDT